MASPGKAQADEWIMAAATNWLFFGDFVRLHILHRAAKRPVCGVQILGELDRRGYRIQPATLYRVLQALYRAGYLKRTAVVGSGRRRRYYQATEDGLSVMDIAKARLKQLNVRIRATTRTERCRLKENE